MARNPPSVSHHRSRLSLLERGIELLFLVEMESEDGVETVEGASQISDVGRFQTSGRNIGDLTGEELDEMEDLAMSPTRAGSQSSADRPQSRRWPRGAVSRRPGTPQLHAMTEAPPRGLGRRGHRQPPGDGRVGGSDVRARHEAVRKAQSEDVGPASSGSFPSGLATRWRWR